MRGGRHQTRRCVEGVHGPIDRTVALPSRDICATSRAFRTASKRHQLAPGPERKSFACSRPDIQGEFRARLFYLRARFGQQDTETDVRQAAQIGTAPTRTTPSNRGAVKAWVENSIGQGRAPGNAAASQDILHPMQCICIKQKSCCFPLAECYGCGGRVGGQRIPRFAAYRAATSTPQGQSL